MSYPFTEPTTRGDLPPLRIHHLMLWTAVAAVMLTVIKADSVGNGFTNQMQASNVPYLLVSSVSLTGLLLGLYWKYQGLIFFDEPGQMGFVFHGVTAAFSVIGSSITTFLRTLVGNAAAIDAMWIYAPISVGWMIIALVLWLYYFRCAKHFASFGWWGSFFRSLAIIAVLRIIGTFVFTFVIVFAFRQTNSVSSMMAIQMVPHLLFGVAEFVCWLIAIRTDFREQRTYHWTHWVGAATWPLLLIVTLLSWLGILIFPQDIEVFVS